MNKHYKETIAFLSNLGGMDHEIKNWIKNKPRMIAIMTFFQAVKADRLFDILNNLEGLFPDDNVKRFHLTNKWIKFYENPSIAITGALEHVFSHVQKDARSGVNGRVKVGHFRSSKVGHTTSFCEYHLSHF